MFKNLQLISHQLQNLLPALYLLYALPAIALAALVTPPFQIPDEPNHFRRAEQVSTGRWITSFHRAADSNQLPASPDKRILMPDIGGFPVNKGIDLAASYYGNLPFQPDTKVRRAQTDSAKQIHWGQPDVDREFANTAIYPPTGYFASALGIVLGKVIHASVIGTLYLARCLNGLACALLCFFALRLSRSTRLLLFTVLLFPMTIALFASTSQDGIIISLACLFFGIISQVESDAEKYYSRKQLIALVVILAAIGAAKPPYFLFAGVFFFLRLDKKTKAICLASAFLPIALWILLNRANYAVVWIPPEKHVNSGLQLKYVLTHPFDYIRLFFRFNLIKVREVVYEFFGVLGWQDLTFPSYFYRAASLALLFAALISISYSLKKHIRLRSVLFVLTVLTVAAVITGQYITWMPLEAPYLGGSQGRYFIPIFPVLALALAGFRKDNPLKTWQIPLFCYILILPLIDTIVMVDQLIIRYYLA